ncbi:MAG: GNAT family N-acetyltransferase [Candidatus Thorarchaeota archaeon]
MKLDIRPVTDDDRNWVASLIRTEWGSEIVVSRGRVHQPSTLEGLIAFSAKSPVSFLTFAVEGDSCEIVTLNALVMGMGVGSALLSALENELRKRGVSRVWLVTTNDNLRAVRFYQRRGYRISAIYPGAADNAQKIKPEIPTKGFYGIEIHDEIELSKSL